MHEHKRGRRLRKGVKAGLTPGTPVFIGEQKRERARIDIINYDHQNLDEYPDADLEKCFHLAPTSATTWINITGLHDLRIIESLGKHFKLHPLTQEDIVNTTQRPKTEEYADYLFVVFKMLTYNPQSHNIDTEHVSLILGKNYVISFIEDEGDVFDGIRERIRSAKGRIRSLSSDYLTYALMDAAIDHYFLALEQIGDYIQELDDRIISHPQQEDIYEIHRLKRDIISLRKAVWPLREEVGTLAKSDAPLIAQETRLFLRDLYDHTIQVIDMVETFRDLLSSMHDIYLSNISNRMNEVMKVLTIIATIFIPLTFVVGVYGMNFQHMPELAWKWGYPMVWIIMIGISAGMLLYFKRKKWF